MNDELAHPANGLTRSRLVRGGWLILSVAAAAYLWAVVLGDGISGLTGGYTLSRRPNSDLPNANVALIVAVGAYVASPVFAWWATPNGRFDIPRWFAVTAAAGLVVFAASKLLV